MSKRSDDLWLIFPCLIATLLLVALPAYIWVSAWRDCRRAGGVLVKDGCDLPACIDVAKARRGK